MPEIPAPKTVIDRDRATALFRILQESLTNVVRHAAASRVVISFRQEGDNLRLTVRDDGRGIQARELDSPRSIGLVGMRERAWLLNGRCEITGGPGKGTTIEVRLPLRPGENAKEKVL